MNDIAHQKMVQDAVKKKFRGRKVLIGKRIPYFPHQSEREYIRLTNSLMRNLSSIMKEKLPEIRDAAKRERPNLRHDDLDDMISIIENTFDDMEFELANQVREFGFKRKVEGVSRATRNRIIREWQDMVRDTLGLDLITDYYEGEIFRDMLEQWVEYNVDLIITIPKEALNKMRNIALEGYRQGRTTTNIMKDIIAEYGIGKRHAHLIARDQIAKLNGQISQKQQQDAGCQDYIWSTSGDNRVRKGHRVLNGKRFSWNNPPIVDERTGRRCHPGEDYQCRCVPLPVFDFNTIDLPINIGTDDIGIQPLLLPKEGG